MLDTDYFGKVQQVLWTDILEKLGYTPRKKRWGGLVMNCIFHKDKSPSLVFSDQKAVCRCFGCNKVCGDQFSFVTSFYSGNQRRAVAFFRKHFGIEPNK